jgi:hypothetical protein
VRRRLWACAWATASVAHAEPAPGNKLVEVGGVFGATLEDYVYGGVAAAGGYGFTSWGWLHAGGDAATELDKYGTVGHLADVHVGIEIRPCTADRVWCFVIGADGGYRHELVRSNVNQQNEDRSGGAAVFRMGLDAGLGQLRVRPIFQGTSMKQGDTSALVIGIAYLW